jgi:hypothetical protein
MMEIISIVCGILGLVGFVVSLICVSIIAGFVRSTHTVQYVPTETPKIEPVDEELAKENEEFFDMPIGKKKKIKEAIQPLDAVLEEINETDTLY